MYIEYVKNRNSPGCLLLRESYRAQGKTHKRTLANLTHWPAAIVDGLKALLNGGKVIAPNQEGFTIIRTLPHGHVAAVMHCLKKLGLPALISPTPNRERAIVMAMIVARILDPASKLATARGWADETAWSSLAEQLDLGTVTVEELYTAMDWLEKQQQRIETKLAQRHLGGGRLALYDLTSTWYEGHSCPLAVNGHNRDGKSDTLQINFGLICDGEGRPIAVEVFPGNTSDPSTVATQIEKFKQRFAIDRVILAGYRGMLTAARIEEELAPERAWLCWITALKAPTIKKLAEQKYIQTTFFDHTDLAEITSPDFPGERLIVCRNPLLAEEWRRKREELLQATERELQKIVVATQSKRSRLQGKDQIGMRVGKHIDHYHMGKHFECEITDTTFTYHRRSLQIQEEAALDGIYVIRTNVPADELSPEKTVGAYKSLSRAERAFRSMKTVDLHVGPIPHHLEKRVRAHVFICMIAYYVEWHMRQELVPLLLDDDDKATADAARTSIVAPAQRSEKALDKAASQHPDDGYVVHSFQTMLKDLATICLNVIQPQIQGAPSFTKITQPTSQQQRALDLLGVKL